MTIDINGREVLFIPTYHPAATIYNRNSRAALDETMRVVSQWLGKPERREPKAMRFGGLMLDMDGTVYKGGVPISGARELISFLRDQRVPFVFLTNNSSHPRSFYGDKLRRLGFDVTDRDVLTSTIATIRFLLSQRMGRTVYPVAVPGVVDELREAGIPLVEDDPDIVLLTFDTTITYEKINRAYRFLKGGAELIATHPDDLCPTEDSYDIDIGPFIRMFEQMCQTTATVIGKPNRLMLEMAAREMGVDPGECVMIGDRLYTDIAMAQNAGTQSVLVLSGETDEGMLEGSDIHPTAVLGSVAELPELILQSFDDRRQPVAGHPTDPRGQVARCSWL